MLFKISLTKEARIWYRLIEYNFLTCVITHVCTVVSAHIYHGKDHARLPGSVMLAALLGLLYQLCIDFPGQITGCAEDYLNKPRRPILSGLLTVQGAYMRWAIFIPVYNTIALLVGGWSMVRVSICWYLGNIIYCSGGIASQWFTKNEVYARLFVYLGLLQAWSIVDIPPPEVIEFFHRITYIIGTLSQIQDLSDYKGDAKLGRKTLPVSFRLWPARMFSALSCCFTPLVLNKFVVTVSNPATIAVQVLLATFSFWQAVLLVTKQSPEEDSFSYMLYVIWYCILPLFSFLIIK